MKKLTYTELFDLLKNLETQSIFSPAVGKMTEEELKAYSESIKEVLDFDTRPPVAILGFDIYKYSQLESPQQDLVPFIFSNLLRRANETFLKQEPILGNYYESDSITMERFIDTGDGGFLIFRTPLDALVFAVIFALQLHEFNSFFAFRKLRSFMGPLTIRYAITYDKIFKYEDNFYGAGIIRNARIMSRDKLNRCLIDSQAYEWFLVNTNGVENLRSILKQDIALMPDYQNQPKAVDRSLFFDSLDATAEGIKLLVAQKLENISVKDAEFELYNLVIQATMHRYLKDSGTAIANFTATLGNLHAAGI